MFERLALIAGLMVTPKAVASQDEVPRAPMSAIDPSRAASEEAAVRALRQRIASPNAPIAPVAEASPQAPEAETSYSEEQRQEMLRQGRAMAERGFDAIFSEDLAFVRDQAQPPGVDPRSLFEFADACLDQEAGHLEGNEDYRERVSGIARDFILKRVNDDLVGPLRQADLDRAASVVHYFSAWDVDQDILRYSGYESPDGSEHGLSERMGENAPNPDAAPGGMDGVAYRHAFDEFDHPDTEEAGAGDSPEEETPEEDPALDPNAAQR